MSLSIQPTEIFQPILLREIGLVQPEYIVTFGLIPFNALVREPIKLSDYYQESVRRNAPKTYNLQREHSSYRAVPCYFPVGRGNPKRAAKLLSMLP